MAHHPDDSLLVSNADKLHNARSIPSDYHRIGPELWRRFTAGADQLWYYQALVEVFAERNAPLADELARTVTELGEAIALSEPSDR